MMRARRIAATVTVAVLSAGVLTGVQPASAATCRAPIPAVAHRGGTERFPENSRDAFRDAGNVGVLRWETDVQFDADNVAWIMHDDTVDRTTDGTGAVADLTTAQMRALRLADGQAVPTLRDVIHDASVDGATVYVELKNEPTDVQLAAVLADLDADSWRHHVIVMSFVDAAVIKVRAADATIATGLLEGTGYRSVDTITPLGVTWYAKHHSSVTAARLDEWSGPLDVAAWTVDDPADWDRMQWYWSEPGSLDGVITNKPAGYLAWAAARVC